MHKVVVGAGLVAALIPAGCSSGNSFNSTDHSGGECGNVPGIACTWANAVGKRGFGIGDGHPIADTPLDLVEDLTFAPDGRAYVADWNNHRVRRVEANGIFTTFMGTEREGDGPPVPADEMPYETAPGCDPQIVELNHPTDIRFAPDGTFVLAAWHDNKIRVVDPATGLSKVLAGAGYGFKGNGVSSSETLFNLPKSIAIDDAGRIYVIDQRNERIRMIDIDAPRTVTTIAGNGTQSYTGDGGPALDATLGFELIDTETQNPSGALALRDHKLYLADSVNQRIRVIDLDTKQISCVAGPGCPIDVTFHYPMDLEFGPDDRLYIAERDGNVIDALDFEKGTLTPIVGNGQECHGTACRIDDTGLDALQVQLHGPYGLAFDAVHNLYVADTFNSRIVRVASEWTK